MNSFFKKTLVLLLAAVVLMSQFPAAVFADTGNRDGSTYTAGSYTAEKISNPDRGEGEEDGLEVGGDRVNSYAWCMAQTGDNIYIGSNRNFLYYGIV